MRFKVGSGFRRFGVYFDRALLLVLSPEPPERRQVARDPGPQSKAPYTPHRKPLSRGTRVIPLRVRASGFKVQGSGFRVQGARCRVQGSGFRVQGAGCRVQGSGFRVQG
ncbi:hypothetical protein T484DRAFT_1650299, partial [Baffinella frigidus]